MRNDWERNGTADALRAALLATLCIIVLLVGIWAVGGLDLFNSLKGY